MAYTSDDLKIMQAWPLERKIRVTQARIMEWYQHYEGKVYVSFSGGKDSTVLLDLARRIYPEIEAVFIDTGLEYPEIRKFVKTFDNVTTIKPEMGFREVIEKYGYPVISKAVSGSVHQLKLDEKSGKDSYRSKCLKGTALDNEGRKSLYNCAKWLFLKDAPFKIDNKCCDVMKKRPAHKFDKKTGKKPIIGTMADESMQRKSKWMKVGCNAFETGNPNSSPISFWTEQDVLHYLKDFNIPYCSVYGEIKAVDQFDGQITISERVDRLITTGCERTGCIFCAYGVHMERGENRFQMLKKTHPKQYDYCIRPVEEKGLGLGSVLDFIGVKY